MCGIKRHSTQLRSAVYAATLLLSSLTATAAPPGQPFQDLQNQIDQLQALLVATQGQLNNLDAQTNADWDALSSQLSALETRVTALESWRASTENTLTQHGDQIADVSLRTDQIGNQLASVHDQLDAWSAQANKLAIAYPSQAMTLDHQLRPGDASCQSGFACSSWQRITGGDTQYLTLTERTRLLVTFTGNYNWDGYANVIPTSVFSLGAVEIYPANGNAPALQQTGWGQDWRWVANAGSDVVFRRVVTLDAGQYIVRAQHRYQYDPREITNLTAWSLHNGVLTLEGID